MWIPLLTSPVLIDVSSPRTRYEDSFKEDAYHRSAPELEVETNLNLSVSRVKYANRERSSREAYCMVCVYAATSTRVQRQPT